MTSDIIQIIDLLSNQCYQNKPVLNGMSCVGALPGCAYEGSGLICNWLAVGSPHHCCTEWPPGLRFPSQ